MLTRYARPLGVIGLLGSLFWLGLNTVLSPDWGPPGSHNYLGYETINRLWGPAFAAMLAGYAGLFARYPLPGRLGGAARLTTIGGLVAMLMGNVAEFWFFTDLPYGPLNARSVAWMLVLLGALSLLIGCALLGWAGVRRKLWPAWASLLFLLALPATLIFTVAAQDLMFLMVIVAGLLAGGLALAPAPAAAPTIVVRA